MPTRFPCRCFLILRIWRLALDPEDMSSGSPGLVARGPESPPPKQNGHGCSPADSSPTKQLLTACCCDIDIVSLLLRGSPRQLTTDKLDIRILTQRGRCQRQAKLWMCKRDHEPLAFRQLRWQFRVRFTTIVAAAPACSKPCRRLAAAGMALPCLELWSQRWSLLVRKLVALRAHQTASLLHRVGASAGSENSTTIS
jgi:hypothetical protein